MKKSKKWAVVILIAVCVVLVILFVKIWRNKDGRGPDIQFGNEELIYRTGIEEAELLENVTAWDEKDGDVSASLRVEAVYTSKDGQSATIIYVAKDSDNNVVKESRNVACDGSVAIFRELGTGSDESDETNESSDGANGNSGNNVSGDNSVGGDSIGQTEPESETDDSSKVPFGVGDIPPEQLAEIDALAPEQPKIYLTDYEVKLSVGQSFDRFSYIALIADDQDPVNDLWRRIQIHGEVNAYTPGTYEVSYLVTDNHGNLSNTAVLKVTVE